MSEKPVIVVGLDIGTTKIACFVGIKDEHNKIEIISMGQTESVGVSRGVVSNINKTVDSIIKAVDQAKQSKNIDGKIDIKVVNIGIAGQHIGSSQHRGMKMRENSDDLITQKDIDSLIEDMYHMRVNPGEEIIQVLPQEYIIDGITGIYDPIGRPGIKLEANFHVITGHVQAGKNINRCASLAGLVAKDIILEPLASAAAVLTEEEKEGGVVLVDIGGGTTDVAIFSEKSIRHTAVIPLGGNIITEDIKQGCTILRNHAEELKIQFGSALATEASSNEVVCIPSFKGRENKEISIKNLARIIQSRMEEIFLCVYNEIEKSGYKNKLYAGIVLTGGGAQLKHITQLCEYVTGIDTRIGYPTEYLAGNNKDSLKSPIYSTGIGLVLEGFKNLKDEDFKVEEVHEEVEERVEEKIVKDRVKTVKGHSAGILKGDFFKKIKEGLGKLMDDTEE